jgi:hypothetical protein
MDAVNPTYRLTRRGEILLTIVKSIGALLLATVLLGILVFAVVLYVFGL